MRAESQYNHFVNVTELAGEQVSAEQVRRLCTKYLWAETHTRGRDVVELACGTGPGLGLLARSARSLVAGDISDAILERARAHYGNRIEILKLDAQALPFADHSKDVILLFEAIYYLPEPEKFVNECRRVMRPGGKLLIVTANKDLYAFNPSPYSHRYFGVAELAELLEDAGFHARFFGDTPIEEVSGKQRLLQPLKQLAVRLNLIPKTMGGKKFLKRLVFGKLVEMPAELTEGMIEYDPPAAILGGVPDRRHKVIYCEGTLAPEN